MTLPTGARRNLPRGGLTRTPMVPLLPPPGGEEHLGFIRVPVDLVHTKLFTARRGQFNKFVDEKLKLWIAWKARQGWFLNSKPTVDGPYDPPTESPGAPEEGTEQFQEHKRYYVKAKFTRTEPKWMPLDHAVWVFDRAKLYGVDLSKPIHDTGEGKGKRVIVADQPAHDPLKFAEEYRKQYGFKREDFMTGSLDEPT